MLTINMNKRQTDIHFKHITAFVVKLFFPLESPVNWKNVYISVKDKEEEIVWVKGWQL